jgi:putative tryptophan/tyrosine transport system substrate-binding protein
MQRRIESQKVPSGYWRFIIRMGCLIIHKPRGFHISVGNPKPVPSIDPGQCLSSIEGSKIQNRRWASLLVTIAWLMGCVGNASAQQTTKQWKIGVLASGTKAQNNTRDEALRQGLRELGYDDKTNLVFEYRFAEGKTDRLPQLARELVEQRPDVIVVGGTSVAVAAKNATNTIPIVVAGAGDLVEAGLVKSFMYPGGNVTGVSRMSPDYFGARLKLIKEIMPRSARVAALSNPKNPGHARGLKDVELGAQSQGMAFQTVNARAPEDLEPAVATAAKGGANALFVMTDAMFNSQVARLAKATIKHRLAAVYDRPDFVEAGGLLSYGVNLADLNRRAAEYVDQILKGKKPSDLTLVEPTKFDLAVNLKTAQQIGLAVPQEMINRAAKVIR